MKFNWKFFCMFGILWSLLFGGMDLVAHNLLGAKIQLVFLLAYSMGLTYLSLKEKKDD